MFFSRHDKNRHLKHRHLKRKRRLLGQVFPFLLIGIVALLAVALSILGVFNAAKTRTYADNAADAGSLAAASILSGAFNDLSLRNKEMWEYYILDRGYYLTLYNLAIGYLDEGIFYSQQAEDAVKAALSNIHTGGCETWTWQKDASLKLYDPDGGINSAAEYALEAAKCVGAVNVLTFYMQVLTDNFKFIQFEHYCEALGMMEQAFVMGDNLSDAESTGLRYAFNNSGQGGDDLGYWLGTGGFRDGTTWPPGADTCANCCGITVTIDFPAQQSYEVEHTVWNYPKNKTLGTAAIPCIGWPSQNISDDPFNYSGSFSLRQQYRAISEALKAAAKSAMSIYTYTDGAHTVCDTCCDPTCHDCNCRCDRDMDPPTTASNDLNTFVTCIRNALHHLNNAGIEVLTMNTLKTINIEIYEKVWRDRAPTFFSNVYSGKDTCLDVINYIDESEYPGLMIRKIDEAILTSTNWWVDCTVVLFCRHTDQYGNVTVDRSTAFSQSEFNVDNLGVVRDFLDSFDCQIRTAS